MLVRSQNQQKEEGAICHKDVSYKEIWGQKFPEISSHFVSHLEVSI